MQIFSPRKPVPPKARHIALEEALASLETPLTERVYCASESSADRQARELREQTHQREWAARHPMANVQIVGLSAAVSFA